jgi:hypothetical protein
MATDETAKLPQDTQPKSKRPGLDRSVQTHIGRKLKAIYHSFASEPVPNSITELLQKLETEERVVTAPGGVQVGEAVPSSSDLSKPTESGNG